MPIQGPAPSDKEVPGQGLCYEPPSDEAGLNYSSSHAVVFFLVIGSEEAVRHGGSGGDPLPSSGTGEAKPGNSNQIQHHRPTEGKVLASEVCALRGGWGSPDAFSSLLRLALRRQKPINRELFQG